MEFERLDERTIWEGKIIRVGKEDGAPAARAALPAANDKELEVLRAIALEGITDGVTLEIAEEPGTEGKEPAEASGNAVEFEERRHSSTFCRRGKRL